ncbi:MAG: leucine-rich repeat domain-containing protein [Clostridia bacterium]|nr:leucine-rich repeat domain-containing protein [Clostridia bacterium]
MSKLLKTLLVALLSFSLVFTIAGCNNDDDGDTTQTGELVYKLITGDDGDQYYAVTGYTVSSDDAVKMATGDFSSFTKAQREITILETYNGKPVKEISAAAFADQVILKKVTVPASVETIGEGAFSGCTNLEELTLPFVGKKADAVNGERVLGYIFGASSTGDGNVQITAKIQKEESEAATTFYVPASLKTLTVTGSRVPECAFYGLTMLQNVSIPNATYIGAYAFYGCSLIYEINVASVVAIYDHAFELCTSLQKVAFGDTPSLEYVGDYAFAGCSRLGLNYASNDKALITLTLPATVNYLGEYAFSDCVELKYVDISSTLITTIYGGTFSACESLQEVKVNANIEVKAGAFTESPKMDASKLIGVDLTKIENGAFGTV